jgi:hypothetical protein
MAYAYGDLIADPEIIPQSLSVKGRAAMSGAVNKRMPKSDPNADAILSSHSVTVKGTSCGYWNERGGEAIALILKAMEYQNANPDIPNPLDLPEKYREFSPEKYRKLSDLFPKLFDLLVKIAWEDDMRTPGVWDVTVKIIHIFQDNINLLSTVLNKLEPNDTLNNVKKKIKKEIKKEIKKTKNNREKFLNKFTSLINYFTLPENEQKLLAFRIILASKGQSSPNWRMEQSEQKALRFLRSESVYGEKNASLLNSNRYRFGNS